MIGQIVKWIKDTSSNIVWKGDIAVALENERFLGIKGTVKDKFFYESNKDYRELTQEEELDLFK